MTEQKDPRLRLKQALVKERMNGLNLTTLEPDFYKTVREWVLSLSGEDRTAMITLFNQIVMSRKSKIITLAHALNTDAEIREKMAPEDREYFDAVANATVEFNSLLV